MMTLNEYKSLKENFVNTMQELIVSGALKPGDRLPTERELAEQYSISRSSVNQGIIDLERMGFLRIIPRKGTYVAEYIQNATTETLTAIMSHNSDKVESSLFKDLMALRILVERECVRLASLNINSAAIAQLSEKTDAIFSTQGDSSAVYEFHRFLVQLSGNSAYTVVFRSFEKMLRSMIQLHYSYKKEVQKSFPYYASIEAAVSRGDSDEAARLMEELLYQASGYLDKILRAREITDAEK